MTDPARRIQSLERENANLHELARAAENYCWTVLDVGPSTPYSAT